MGKNLLSGLDTSLFDFAESSEQSEERNAGARERIYRLLGSSFRTCALLGRRRWRTPLN
jgi:hypothetical protein